VDFVPVAAVVLVAVEPAALDYSLAEVVVMAVEGVLQ